MDLSATKKKASDESSRRMKPASTPEARENQIIAKAIDRAEQMIEDGTASSQIICHYLKLGTVKERAELEKLRLETELIKAKTEAVKSAKNTEELYAKALAAMRSYSGNNGDEPV